MTPAASGQPKNVVGDDEPEVVHAFAERVEVVGEDARAASHPTSPGGAGT
jgi:hypothetical protein